MLNEIRDIVHPLFSSVPPPELDRKQLLKKIKITTADLPRPHLRTRGQPTINVTTSTTGRNDNTNDGGDILPHPVVRYAHGKGCVYSDKPDVVVKSAEFVKTVDAFARTRLDNLTRLLDAGITYVDNDLELACTRNETSTPTSSAASTSPSSASPSETESDSDFDTNTTTTSFTSSSARRGVEDDGHADLDISLTRLFARLAANEVTDKMRSEQIRLQACLATSSLAKGLYWKRCNGVFRNALDDELLPASISITASTTTGDSAGEAMGDDKEANATVDVTLKTTHVDASETNEATKNPFALTSTTTFSRPFSHARDVSIHIPLHSLLKTIIPPAGETQIVIVHCARPDHGLAVHEDGGRECECFRVGADQVDSCVLGVVALFVFCPSTRHVTVSLLFFSRRV